jgi:CBS domain-containing protein
MRLKDIMSLKVECVRPSETLEHALTTMHQQRIHHLAVVDRRRVVGMLTDAAAQTSDAAGVERVEDAMSRHVVTGTPGMTVRQAANRMRGRAESALLVVEADRIAGIVTVSDLLDVLGRGVDRPLVKSRRVLRDRGTTPRASLGADRASLDASRPSRRGKVRGPA